MDDIARRIAGLTPARRALLERRLFAVPADSPLSKGATIQPRGRTGRPPRLSFAQERLWFLDRLEPGTATYNLPLMLALGDSDDTVVEAAWRDLCERHQILRTAIGSVEGEPVQLVADRAVPLRRIDLRDRPAAADATIRAEMLHPFDFAAGPPVRATILRESGSAARLLIVLHHILSDGWSNGIVARDFAALLAGRTLPPPALHYADYAEWQRGELAGPQGTALLDYWQAMLAGAPQMLTLPCDRSGSPRDRTGSATRIARLSSHADVGMLARSENATAFMVLLAAFFVVLHRFAALDDMLVGTPVANRDRVELEPLVGLFVNTLPLRARITGEMRFRDVVRQVRATVLDGHANKDLPFERLVSRLVSARDPKRPPLVQILFALEPGTAPDDATQTSPAKAKFDLTLTVLDDGDRLTALWDHDRAILDDATVGELAGAYDVLLAAMLADPDRRIDAVPLMTEDRRTVLLEGAGGAIDAAVPATLYGLTAAQAARTPDAPAVVTDDDVLSFAALIRQVDAAAAGLRRAGVGPGCRVGLCVARSPAMIVGILAVLKLGGAYVPLDPDYPDDRLAYMVGDAGLTLILAEPGQYDRLAAATSTTLYSTDLLMRDEPVTDQPASYVVHPDDTAYVIYTSGSTGRPKGVSIPHRAIVNQMRWLLACWPMTAEDRVLQRTSLSFDASVWEIFAPLMAGAALVLPRHQRGAFADVGADIRRHRVTIVQLVPSLLRVLLEQRALDDVPSLRLLFCGGEALPADLARAAVRGSGTRVVNLYGPTEAAVNATFHAVAPDADDATVPIGRPVANMRAFVLDARMEPVPPGVVGELYLGGIGLADGYVGRAALTAAAFVPDPFVPDLFDGPAERLYRTGDLARRRHDGALEFSGRNDRQVKLRGFRVELAETEAALRALPDVADAVVQAEDNRLVAWIVSRDGIELSAGRLRSALARILPDHMIPTMYVPVTTIPLLPNGKTDRAALVSIGTDIAPRSPDAAAEPRTATEHGLTTIWQGLLGGVSVGLHDDFFAIGGHSLLAVQVASRIQDRFGIAVALRQVFETPTIAALAGHIDTAIEDTGRSTGQGKGSPEAAKPAARATRHELARRIARIPEHEIDAMLSELAETADDGLVPCGEPA